MKKKKTKLAIIVVTIFLIIFIWCGIQFFVSLQPVSKTSDTMYFEIEEGASTREILENLKKENVIKNSDSALIYLKIFNNVNFKAGKFKIDRSWSADKLFEYLSDDQNIVDLTVNFTIFPGDTLRMIASNLQEYTNLNANEILEAWNDEDYIKILMVEYPFLTDELFNEDIGIKLEGYLFPDTYNIYKETNIDVITRIFLNNTKKYYEIYFDDFSNAELSIHEIFTLASIIDYEASGLEDRKNVSSVFYNRMNNGMPLQSSVTRCYAISLKENRNISNWKECEIELDFESPYDTYQNYGLPPGPIRAVSETSIVAALNPNDTDYLYFVADVYGDGSVHFSETYAQHVQLINEFLS